MAAFHDDKPLVAQVDEDWDEITTGTQIMRPDWDFSPIRMRTMHHLPHVFFDRKARLPSVGPQQLFQIARSIHTSGHI